MQAIGSNKRISFEFQLTKGDTIYVCGYRYKESFKFAEFFIELGVPMFTSEEAKKGYIGGSGSNSAPIKWSKFTRMGQDTECIKLSEIPLGHHILSINTGEPTTRHVCGVSHIITF